MENNENKGWCEACLEECETIHIHEPENNFTGDVSKCCKADLLEEPAFFMCQCGHEQQIHEGWAKITTCPTCKRIGCWTDSY